MTVLTETAKSCLLLVDPNNDFVKPEGNLTTAGAMMILANINDLLQQGTYDYYVMSQDWHIDPGEHWSSEPDWVTSFNKHCEADTWGAEIAKELDQTRINAIFKKGHYTGAFSAFEGVLDSEAKIQVSLNAWLRAHYVNKIDVVGFLYDFCVRSSAIDAAELQFETRVLKKYTIASSAKGSDYTTEILHQHGISIV